jgi:hypothetical protein
MNDEEYWSAARTVRLAIADMLDSLSPTQWDAQSVIPEWRVRDVAAHLAMVAPTALALLLLLTGRDRIVVDSLHGPGVVNLAG